MGSRDQILQRVRDALAPLPERAAYPDYADDAAVMRQLFPEGADLWEVFAARLRLVNGRPLTQPEEVARFLDERGAHHGYCDPALWPQLRHAFGPQFQVELEFDRTRVDDFAFGITRADAAVAETGTVILRDATTSSRLGALAPWIHVAVFPRRALFATLPEAVAALGSDPNIVFVTGPSKTADVEGILIEGVHGPGEQLALGM
ncbi:MAG: LUD domain-containing protein [Verrucomicrobia bacterium]|nr:LUD domain-containing protein [Verrucomicrobiota bacterium]